MDGNSPGLGSVDALKALELAADEWRTKGIGGWLEAKPDCFTDRERIGRAMAALVGAQPDEVRWSALPVNRSTEAGMSRWSI